MRPVHWLYTVPLRIRSLFNRHRADSELDEELQYHLERKTEEFITKGLSPEDAHYAALREFRDLEQSKEMSRDTRKVNWIHDFLQDLHFGARMLRRNPGFTAIAVLTLSLGMGANASIFSVVNAVLLRPLSYPSPDRIVSIEGYSPVGFIFQKNEVLMTWSKWAVSTQSFDRLAAYSTGDLNLSISGAYPERVAAAEVSQNFFETFGLPPFAGRTFLQEEEVQGHPSVAILSATLCSHFGNPGDVIGRTLLLNGKQTVVVGVMPVGFQFPEKTQLWLPMAWSSSEGILQKRAFFYFVVGRLKRGVSLAQARQELSSIQAQERGEQEKAAPGITLPPPVKTTIVSLHDQLAGSSRPALLLLLGAVGFVLLIACADVANLLLVRAVQRQREIAMRAALGASRLRLIRQGLTESLLLSSLGGLGGLFLAYWSLDVFRRYIPARMLFVQDIGLDTRVLFFLMGVSVLSGLVFGLFPVAHAMRIDINEPLKGGATNSPGRNTFQGLAHGALVIAEIAMALVLLAGAGLLIKSFWRLINIDPGFQGESALTARIELQGDLYRKNDQRAAFMEQTQQKVSALPGVLAASYVSDLPFGKMDGIGFRLLLEKETAAHLAASQDQFALFYEVSSDYFRAMGIPLLAGRAFTDRDRAGAPSVVVINHTIAELYWPGENPIGRRISLPGSDKNPKWAEIVGIVGDTKHQTLDEQSSPEYYVPALQSAPFSAFLVVRISGDAGAAVTAIRKTMAQVDGTLPLSSFSSMSDRVSESVAEPRFRTLLIGVFAALALILATAGIYGVMSYSVAQRTREIGIRVAMGAGRGDVLSLILGHSMKLALIGVAIGLAASWGLTRLLASVLYSVAPHDITTLAAVSILLSAVALLASYIPARRAMRVDPLVALRYE